VRVQSPAEGTRQPWRIRLEDDTGGVDLVFWDDVRAGFAGSPEALAGRRVRVRAEVGRFRGRPQLRLVGASDLQPAEASAP
jgi:DNA/RNA endonuclease YhcR with UshA esterase domain